MSIRNKIIELDNLYRELKILKIRNTEKTKIFEINKDCMKASMIVDSLNKLIDEIISDITKLEPDIDNPDFINNIDTINKFLEYDSIEMEQLIDILNNMISISNVLKDPSMID